MSDFPEPCTYISHHESLRRKLSRPPPWLLKEPPYVPGDFMKGKRGLINYLLEGPDTGHLVIGIHGLNGSRCTFNDITKLLVDWGYRVLTYDLYGHGLSGSVYFNPLGETYGLSFYVKQLEELLEYLNLSKEPCTIVSFSMGCVIAAGYCATNPNLVERLMFLSPAGMLKEKQTGVGCIQRCPCCINILPLCVCRCCFDKDTFIKQFSDEEIESGVAELIWTRLMWQFFVKGGVVQASLGSVSRLPLWDATSVFKNADTGLPVLVVWGAEDTVAPFKYHNELISCFSNVHLITHPKGTHILMSECPKLILSMVLSFLSIPKKASLTDWKYLFPYGTDGEYVPRDCRAPPDRSPSEYFQSLGSNWLEVVRVPEMSAHRARMNRLSRPSIQELPKIQEMPRLQEMPRVQEMPRIRDPPSMTPRTDGSTTSRGGKRRRKSTGTFPPLGDVETVEDEEATPPPDEQMVDGVFPKEQMVDGIFQIKHG